MIIRLIEHQPAWEIHALLRFYNIPYLSEYSPAPIALGRQLPVLVTPTTLYSGDQILECPIFDQARRALTSTEKDIEALVSSAIRSSFYHIFNHLQRKRNDHITTERQYGSLFIGYFYATLQEIGENLSLCREGHYPNETEEELLGRLERKYSELDLALNFAISDRSMKDISICNYWTMFGKTSPKLKRLCQADALLFGHLARALCHPLIIPILAKFENIGHYFHFIARTFFGSCESPTQTFLWEASVDSILNNPFLSPESCAEVKEIIAQGVDHSDTVDYPALLVNRAEMYSHLIEDEPTEVVKSLEEVLVLPEHILGAALTVTLAVTVTTSFIGYGLFWVQGR